MSKISTRLKNSSLALRSIVLGIFSLAGAFTSLESAQFDVHSYGAIGDGTMDDTKAINDTIAAAINAGPDNEVYLPSGNYRLGSAQHSSSLYVNSGKGLTIRGTATTVLISEDPGWAHFSLNHCTNVTLKTLSLDRKHRVFTQGRIVSSNPGAKTCDVTIDPGYDEADAHYISPITHLRVFSYPETETYQQDVRLPVVISRKKLGTRKWRFTLEAALPATMKGAKFALWNDMHNGHGIVMTNSQDCLVEDVDYWGRGANAGLYLVGNSGTTTFRRLKIDIPPGSTDMIACSGGGQLIDTRGSLIYDDCDIVKVDDDGADIFTAYRRVLAQINARTIQVQNNPPYQVGDTIAIVDYDLKQERMTAIVTAVTLAPGGACNVSFDREVTILRSGSGNDKNRETAIFDRVDRVINYSMACKSATFTNCRMQSLRARPINLKAQNTLIENCTFHGCQSPAIMAGPEFYYPEGPTINGLIIRNNRFLNCNSANIYISHLDTRIVCKARENRNILIENNTFVNYSAHGETEIYKLGAAIYIANADGVTIRNNDMSQSAANAPRNVSRIFVVESDNILIEANNEGLSK